MISAKAAAAQSRYAESKQQDHGKAQSSKVLGRLGIDVSSAIVAGLAVSPLVTVIDTAVTEVAFGTRTFWASTKAVLLAFATRPHRIMATRPFAAMFLLYTGTYITTNAADTLHSLSDEDISPTTTSTGWGKFAAISTVNMGLALYKEAAFAKAFNVQGKLRPMPASSYGVFVLRDTITLFASFNLPPMLAPKLPEGWEESGVSRLSMAQLAAPAASQVIATPLHLWGLDMYKNAGRNVPAADRLAAIRKAMTSATAARICRVIPGLGVGNVINTRLRSGMIDGMK